MFIVRVGTEAKEKVSIEKVLKADLKKITKARYFFNWRERFSDSDVYKLTLFEDADIKGLVAIRDIPSEKRIEIVNIAVGKENVLIPKNKGQKTKEFERIAPCLLSFVARSALARYNLDACVSLIPKTELRGHYIKEYGMQEAGISLYLDAEGLDLLIAKYE